MRVWIRGVIAVVMALAVFLLADGVLQANGVGGFTPSAQELTDGAADPNQSPLIVLGLAYWAQTKTSDPDLLYAARQARIRAWRQLGQRGPVADLMLETALQNPTDYTVMEASFALMDVNDLGGLRELTGLVTGGDAPPLEQPDLPVSAYLIVLQRRGRASEAIAFLEGLNVGNWAAPARRRLDEFRVYSYLAADRPDAVLDWLRAPAADYCLAVQACVATRQVAEARARAMRGECDQAEAILTGLVEALRAEPFREEIDSNTNAAGDVSSSTISSSAQWECRALGLLGRREEAIEACLLDQGTSPSSATAASRVIAENNVVPRLECSAEGAAG